MKKEMNKLYNNVGGGVGGGPPPGPQNHHKNTKTRLALQKGKRCKKLQKKRGKRSPGEKRSSRAHPKPFALEGGNALKKRNSTGGKGTLSTVK